MYPPRMRAAIASVLSLLLLTACDGDGEADGGPPGPVDASTDDAGGGDDDAGPGDDGGDGVDAGAPVNPLDGAEAPETVQGGFMFLEGPHWREADMVLLFTDIPADTIFRLTPPSTVDVFRNPSQQANGLATLPDGRLLAAEHGGRRVSVSDGAGAPEDFAATDAMGRTFHSPNDIAVRSDGTVYFTDPPYGLAGRPQEIPYLGVYRVTPTGDVSVEWMSSSDTQRPNGVALSPDESTLYVADTADGLVRSFSVATGGALSDEATFAPNTPGADGMAVDTAGNVFVAAAPGVMVFAPDGSMWGVMNVAEPPANVGFGDEDHLSLYITARTTLYRVRLTIPGRI